MKDDKSIDRYFARAGERGCRLSEVTLHLG